MAVHSTQSSTHPSCFGLELVERQRTASLGDGVVNTGQEQPIPHWVETMANFFDTLPLIDPLVRRRHCAERYRSRWQLHGYHAVRRTYPEGLSVPSEMADNALVGSRGITSRDNRFFGENLRC